MEEELRSKDGNIMSFCFVVSATYRYVHVVAEIEKKNSRGLNR